MSQILIKSKRTKLDNLRKAFPDALILDVTSKGKEPWIRFSPFFPHNNIPIPFSTPQTACSVEGIWQGLKVFRNEGIDLTKFHNKSMKNIKRSVRTCGPILGHQQGVYSEKIFNYKEAREKIYIPTYFWVLENCVGNLVEELSQEIETRDVIFLDYQTNSDINNLASPLSHAALIKKFLEKI